MPVYSISYDLNSPGQKYKCLEEKIEEKCNGSCKYVESSWIVKYSGNASALSDELRKCLDKNDHILVIKVINEKQGWLSTELWNKINSFFN